MMSAFIEKVIRLKPYNKKNRWFSGRGIGITSKFWMCINHEPFSIMEFIIKLTWTFARSTFSSRLLGLWNHPTAARAPDNPRGLWFLVCLNDTTMNRSVMHNPQRMERTVYNFYLHYIVASSSLLLYLLRGQPTACNKYSHRSPWECSWGQWLSPLTNRHHQTTNEINEPLGRIWEELWEGEEYDQYINIIYEKS